MRTLEHFVYFVNQMNASNSRLHKQAILRQHKNDLAIQKYLQIAFDPYKVYGISTKKLHKELSDVTKVSIDPYVFTLFEYLEAHNTGTSEEIFICQRFLKYAEARNHECAKVLEALICKNLSIGCDAKTINKEIPGLIPTFNVQLANKYFDKPQYVEGKEFAITTKIDGGRIIALKENGHVSFYTRAGQKYEGLVDLEEEMLNFMPDNICLDGEITLLNKGQLSSKEQYKETMKIVRTKEKTKHGVKMLVFDWMPAEDFKKQQCDFSYKIRRVEVERIFDNEYDFKYFELLPILYRGSDTSKITEILEEEIANGEEGIMINVLEAKYEFKRTNGLLKCKKFDSLDLEVVGVEEGSGRLAGMLGAVQVRYKDGNIVRVGSGFSDAERKQYWANPELILNKLVEVKYFEETTNADKTFSLRFPTWCSNIRTDKLTPDY